MTAVAKRPPAPKTVPHHTLRVRRPSARPRVVVVARRHPRRVAATASHAARADGRLRAAGWTLFCQLFHSSVLLGHAASMAFDLNNLARPCMRAAACGLAPLCG